MGKSEAEEWARAGSWMVKRKPHWEAETSTTMMDTWEGSVRKCNQAVLGASFDGSGINEAALHIVSAINTETDSIMKNLRTFTRYG